MNIILMGRLCLVFGMVLLQAGCGGGGGGGGGSSTASGATVISGVASKGPLNGANIRVYQLNADGSQGAQLGSTTQTAADGSYTANVGTYNGAVMVEASGGTYTDEATGATNVHLAAPLHTALSNVSGNTTASVTPLTEMAKQMAESASGIVPPGNIAAAQISVQKTLSGGIDIVRTLPANALNPSASATSDEKQYGLALAAVSEHANANSQTISAAITDLSALAKGNLSATDADMLKTSLRTDISTFIHGSRNATDLKDENELEIFVNAGGSAGGTGTTTPTGAGSYTLLAWNDLGMHCVDGKDYSVFSILPPFNNLHAQLQNSTTNTLVTSGVTLTYESVADTSGSINTSSAGKTNFWDWVSSLFGAILSPNVGLTGNAAPSITPKPLAFSTANNWFEATGIPVTPYDDTGAKNFYPMVKVVAKDASNNILATARVVLPVSDEMSCKSCHATTSVTTALATAAKPVAGWVNDTDPEKDWKKNILRLHDEKQFNTSTANAANRATFVSALAAKGYKATGLYDTAVAGQPILCAGCHTSNALSTPVFQGISALTSALHSKHATVLDPATSQSLDSSSNRTACYLCHPGSVTKCLRGAMGKAVDASGNMLMGCQSCHGKMSAVGNAARTGWLQEPACQSCHHDGVRDTTALDASGNLKVPTDLRFATTANVPAAGFNLYRFSKGHGNLQCEACHGATHAEYPSSHVNDNILSMDTQGHTGTISECSACHKTVPTTTSGGPHGMHTTGSAWVSAHQHADKTTCTSCHGADYRGTVLSQVKMPRSFSVEGKTVNYTAGQAVTCYDCHNGPNP